LDYDGEHVHAVKLGKRLWFRYGGTDTRLRRSLFVRAFWCL